MAQAKFSSSRWAQLAGIKESSDDRAAKLSKTIEGKALAIIDSDQGKTLIIYDPKGMGAAITSGEEPDEDGMKNSIEGMVRIEPPVYGPTGDENSCLGAWEVTRSGVRSKGVGVGDLLYKLAASACPSKEKLLMPDRGSVSPSAESLWKKRFSKMSKEEREQSALDDEENHYTEVERDDCKVHPYDKDAGPGSNPLNHVYKIDANVNVEALSSAHESFMENMSWETGHDLDKLFLQAAKAAFEEFL